MSPHKRIGIPLAVGAAMLASPVFAWDFPRTTITSFGTWNDGHAVIAFADFNGNVACPGGGNLFSLGVASAPGQKQMIEVAMAAFLAGKPVEVHTSPGVCDGGQEVITFLRAWNR